MPTVCNKTKFCIRPKLVLVCLFACAAQPVHAQDIQQASHNSPAATAALGQTTGVRFAQVPAKAGDHVTQQVAMELNLQTSIVQQGQVAQQQETTMRRGQRREVEVLEVQQGQVVRARVKFPHSRHLLPEHSSEQGEQVQPVEGKTYLLTRKEGQLNVRYPDNTIPPKEEFEIVFGSMQSLGKPNPLAKFLLERDFKLGQTLELPQEIAAGMLGLGEEIGQVTKFQLTLAELKEFSGHPCAEFTANIHMGSGPGSSLSLQATGPVVIRLDTCRTVLADFTGPLQMNSVEQTPQGSYQHQAEGSLRVAVRSDYLQ